MTEQRIIAGMIQYLTAETESMKRSLIDSGKSEGTFGLPDNLGD